MWWPAGKQAGVGGWWALAGLVVALVALGPTVVWTVADLNRVWSMVNAPVCEGGVLHAGCSIERSGVLRSKEKTSTVGPGPAPAEHSSHEYLVGFPDGTTRDITVDQDSYEKAQVGDPITVRLWQGTDVVAVRTGQLRWHHLDFGLRREPLAWLAAVEVSVVAAVGTGILLARRRRTAFDYKRTATVSLMVFAVSFGVMLGLPILSFSRHPVHLFSLELLAIAVASVAGFWVSASIAAKKKKKKIGGVEPVMSSPSPSPVLGRDEKG